VSYYHILHQRRNDLKLSIQEVSNQTRLAPQYIQAIEEHNLDVFSDDFSFVRYFVHAYCDAIGVNWQMIAKEVDDDVNEFARRRDMALTQAQKRMVAQMSSVNQTKKKPTKKEKKKKKKGFMQKQISQVSMYLHSNTKNSRLIKILVLIGIAGLCILSVLNLGIRYVSNQKQANIDKQKAAALQEKEAETDILASERKKAQEASALQITAIEGQTNTYQISNIQEDMKTLELSITLPSKTKITVTKDDTTLNDSSKVYTNTFSQSLEVSENCTFVLTIETYSDNEIAIDGNTISFDKTNWKEGDPAVITFQLGSGNPNAVTTTTEDTTDDSDYSYDESDYDYYTEDYAYEDEYTEQTDTY
jgi:cytoskeletal protein RodZ